MSLKNPSTIQLRIKSRSMKIGHFLKNFTKFFKVPSLYIHFSKKFCVIYFLFILDIDIASCADGSTPDTTDRYMKHILKKLEHGSNMLLHKFNDRLMKANPGKHHLLSTVKEDCSIKFKTQESPRH